MTNNKYTFDINDYEMIREVKRGGFGVVSLVKHKETSVQFAAKTNLIDTGISVKKSKQLISREVGILIKVRHPTIINFKGYSQKDFDGKRNITILMDYMKRGSLSELIELDSKGLCPVDYDNTKRQIILIGISKGMMLLHKLHVIHRDLKAENILLDDNFNPKITDFGLSKFFDPLHSMSQSIVDTGTAAYMAPEVIESDHFNTKADVYAFGILMNEVLSGKRAYSDFFAKNKRMTGIKLKTEVCNGLRPEIDPSLKKGLRKIIEKCLLADPKKRPSFHEIYMKLSLSQDDYYFEFEDERFEQNMIEDDEEEELENEEDEIDEEGLFLCKKYCLDDVDFGEILDYIEMINEETNSILNSESSKDKEIEELKEQIKELKKNEIKKNKEIEELKELVNKMQINDQTQNKKQKELIDKIDSIDHKMKKKAKKQDIKNIKDQIEELEKQNKVVSEIKDQIEEIQDQAKSNMKVLNHQKDDIEAAKKLVNNQLANNNEIKNQIDVIKSDIKEIEKSIKMVENTNNLTKDIEHLKKSMSLFCSAEPNLDSPGILEQLKMNEISKFDPAFITSLSSNDLYNLLIQGNTITFSTGDSGDFFIEFELEEPITINGMKISNGLNSFSKSFDISVDGKIVKSIKEANDLNGKYNSMTINFDPILGRKIRFIQTGPNWDKDTKCLHFKCFELLSTEPKYSSGIFSTFIKENESHDPHNIPVFITASDFDLNSFYLLRSEKNTRTLALKSSWFQVEFKNKLAILNGFRIKRIRKNMLKSYKIICTDDINKPIDKWTTLIDIIEKSIDEHNIFDIYNFNQPSPPTKIIRLIITGDNWDNNFFLQFSHFDLFGRISIEDTINYMINKSVLSNDIKTIKQKVSTFCYAEPGLKTLGILEQLKFKEKSKFDHLFIASQSSCDCYNIIDPKTSDDFSSSNFGDFFIEFEFEEIIKLNGMKIYRSGSNFPSSFDITVDGKIVKSIKNSRELNTQTFMTVNFDQISGKKIRFIQTGKNLDENTNFLNIKRFELLSPDPRYSDGVFNKLVNNAENKDPHFARVFITSSCFDLNSIHLHNSNYNTYTFSMKDSWLQIELTRGYAILNGFRINRNDTGRPKSYKVICTDNASKPMNQWITLFCIVEEKKENYGDTVFFNFTRPSPPTRFIRFTITDKTWDNELYLVINHFDVFGTYI